MNIVLIMSRVIAICFFTVVGFATYAQSSVNAYKVSGLLVEKTYIHTDKDFYIAGEIMWFKLYAVDAYTTKISDFNKIGYVEVLNREGQPILQAKIALGKAGGSGSFYLPLTIKSDEYIIRVYTAWMKNAGAQNFFEKRVTIVNTMRADGVAESPVKEETDINSWEVAFFPEGGDMIEDVETKVGFRVIGSDGKGIAASGVIVDNTGDTLQRFHTTRFGMGHFLIKPVAGKTYRALLKDEEGRTGSSALPKALSQGYGLNIVEYKNTGAVRLKLSFRGSSSQQPAIQVMLVAHQGGKASFSAAYNLGNARDERFIEVDKEKLRSGVNYFTLFNGKGQPLAERLVFIKPDIQSNLEISTSKKVFKAKEKIELTTSVTSNVADSFHCSISIYKMQPWYKQSSVNMLNYFLLGSDLKGSIESPSFYLSDNASVEDVDNLVLTHGWRRFKSDSLYQTNYSTIPEYKGHFITGSVVNTTTGKRVAGADCFLTVPSSPLGLYTATSDAEGIVRFEINGYYGPGEIIVQPHIDSASNYRVDIFTPFSEALPYTSVPPFYIDSTYKDALQEHSIAMQTQNIYFPDSIKRVLPAMIEDTLPFFGKSEYNYYLDEYKRFNTMEEVLREYVMPIGVAQRKGALVMDLYNPVIKDVYKDNILVMLDGVPLIDHNKIFSYDPHKVKQLRVITRKYLMNSRLFSGLVSFETYKGRFDGFELAPSLVAIDYEGLQLQREFYIPKSTATEENKVPDMRTTLFWTPNFLLKTENKSSIVFPASEQKGTFWVVLEGIGQKGEPIFATTTFTVE